MLIDLAICFPKKKGVLSVYTGRKVKFPTCPMLRKMCSGHYLVLSYTQHCCINMDYPPKCLHCLIDVVSYTLSCMNYPHKFSYYLKVEHSYIMSCTELIGYLLKFLHHLIVKFSCILSYIDLS